MNDVSFQIRVSGKVWKAGLCKLLKDGLSPDLGRTQKSKQGCSDSLLLLQIWGFTYHGVGLPQEPSPEDIPEYVYILDHNPEDAPCH